MLAKVTGKLREKGFNKYSIPEGLTVHKHALKGREDCSANQITILRMIITNSSTPPPPPQEKTKINHFLPFGDTATTEHTQTQTQWCVELHLIMSQEFYQLIHISQVYPIMFVTFTTGIPNIMLNKNQTNR